MEQFEHYLIPKLAHSNKALVLASAKLFLHFMELFGGRKDQKNLQKIIAALIGFFDSKLQNSFIALQVLVAIEKKYRSIPLQFKYTDFLIQHHEPIYIKLLKLKMLKRISRKQFDMSILSEIFNYVKSPDIEFSLESV